MELRRMKLRRTKKCASFFGHLYIVYCVHVTASSTVTDDVTHYVTHGIFNINL